MLKKGLLRAVGRQTGWKRRGRVKGRTGRQGRVQIIFGRNGRRKGGYLIAAQQTKKGGQCYEYLGLDYGPGEAHRPAASPRTLSRGKAQKKRM